MALHTSATPEGAMWSELSTIIDVPNYGLVIKGKLNDVHTLLNYVILCRGSYATFYKVFHRNGYIYFLSSSSYPETSVIQKVNFSSLIRQRRHKKETVWELSANSSAHYKWIRSMRRIHQRVIAPFKGSPHLGGWGAEEHTAHISVASRESDLKALLWCSGPTEFAGRLTLFLERRSEVAAFWKAEWWCRKRLGFGTSRTRWIPVFLLQGMEDT